MAKRKNSEEKRKHIRYSAYICFRENGYYQTSIDDICTAADISKGSFYWHYGAKIDVFIDILETWAREVIDELLEQFEAATQSPDRIRLLSQALEREFHRARAIVPLWAEFSLLGRKDREIQISIGKFFRRARAAISEILRQTAYGSLSEDEIQATSSVILGAYMGLILQEFADPSTNASDWASNFVGILRLILQNPTDKSINIQHDQGERVSPQKVKSITKKASVTLRQAYSAARNLILEDREDIDEKWVQGWKIVGYYKKGLVCHLKMKDTHVELAFHQGVQLSDPKGLLSGSGKNRRSVQITSSEFSEDLRRLVCDAFAKNKG